MSAPTDTHLEALGTYLKAKLNAAGAALATPLIVVADVTYLTDFLPLDKFPLLQVYRVAGNGWEGQEIQKWEVVYSLTNFTDPYDVPRILAWVAEWHNPQNIRALIETYFSDSSQCGRLDKDSFAWNYGYKFLGGNKVPSLKVGFSLFL